MKIAEKIEGLEELIRRLRKETRAFYTREIELVDLVGSADDLIDTGILDVATYTVVESGAFLYDEAKYGVSDYA